MKKSTKLILTAVVAAFLAACIAVTVVFVVKDNKEESATPETTIASEKGDVEQEESVSAIDTVKALDNKTLGITASIDHYLVLANTRSEEVKGVRCVKIAIAPRKEDGTFSDSDIISTFYVSEDGKKIFKLEADGSYSKVK